LIVSLIYIDRVFEINPKACLNRLNVHKFVLISMMIAIKFNEDDCYTNKFYAEVGGLTLKELNILELEFCKLIRFKFHVLEEEFNLYIKYLQKYANKF